MTKQYVYGMALAVLAAGGMFTSCNNEDTAEVMGGKAPLSVNVRTSGIELGVKGTGLVTATSLADGESIGVVLAAADGSNYDGIETYTNLEYTATGDVPSQAWSVAEGTKVLLSSTVGKAYAYYPYGKSVSISAIPVDISNQDDVMYAEEVSGLSNANPAANFTMNHAQAAVKFSFQKNTYTGAGNVTKIVFKSEGFAASGVLNGMTGVFDASQFDGVNADVTLSPASLTAGEADGTFESSEEYMVIPTGTAGPVAMTLTVDGANYKVSSGDVTLLPGKIYDFKLKLNAVDVSVTSVGVTPWGTGDAGADIDVTDPMVPTASEIKVVAADGSLVDYTAVTGDKSTYKGVAVIKGEHKFMIQRDFEDKGYYWGSSSDVTNLEDIQTVDGNPNRTSGYLAGSSSPQLEKDFTKWTAGALADFDGESNTAKILASGYSNGNPDMGKKLSTYRETKGNDWYIPACGQLALIYLNLAEINQALEAIEAIQLNTWDYYWSSSEYDSDFAWTVFFDEGFVYNSNSKSFSYRVVLVQDL